MNLYVLTSISIFMTFSFNFGNNNAAAQPTTNTQPTFFGNNNNTNTGFKPTIGNFGSQPFGTTGGFGAPATAPKPQVQELSQEDRNKDVTTHKREINQIFNEHQQKFQLLSQQIFDYDKENYLLDQQLNDMMSQLNVIENEQGQVDMYLQNVCTQQNELVSQLNKQNNNNLMGDKSQLLNDIFKLSQSIKPYLTDQIQYLKRINELNGLLCSLKQQIK